MSPFLCLCSCRLTVIRSMFLRILYLQLFLVGCLRQTMWRNYWRLVFHDNAFGLSCLFYVIGSKPLHINILMWFFFLQIFMDILPEIVEHRRVSIVLYLLRYFCSTSWSYYLNFFHLWFVIHISWWLLFLQNFRWG